MMSENGVENVTCIAVSVLRKEYKAFELKRRLLQSHDFFMVDSR
jgi:hypothetical protein